MPIDLYEMAPNPYVTVGVDGLIRKANCQAGILFGCSPEELVGRTVYSLHPDSPADQQKAHAIRQRFLAGEDIEAEEVQLATAKGRVTWIDHRYQTGARDRHAFQRFPHRLPDEPHPLPNTAGTSAGTHAEEIVHIP